MRLLIRLLFQLISLSATLHLFVDVLYLKVYFSYNFNYQTISDSSHVVITASAEPYKSTNSGLKL